jgi:trans-2,3-dihydro-3-hydroxyanthranilate isomerase
MAERFFDVWRVDVFTDTPLTGNPLAVFPRATGLWDIEMQAIAREMNLSETAFLLPPTNPSASYRLRIFTPAREIPFAGHPSIGSAYVAALEGLVPRPEGASIVYTELAIGVLPLEILVDGDRVVKVTMTQGDPALGATMPSVAPLAKALRIPAREIGGRGLKPRLASTGSWSLQVPLRSLEAVRRVDPDPRALGTLLATLGPQVDCYVFALETERPEAHVHARMFSPSAGIAEDPATGSAAGACGAYLAASGRLPAPTFVIEQGIEIHHPSRIEVAVEADGKTPKIVRVGGQVTPLIRGNLRLPP